MLDIDTLGDYLRQNPGVMQDRIRIQSILRDIFPKDKLTVNLLLMGFEENIFSLLGQNHSEAELTRLANAIVDNYGVTRENANYIVETWLGVVFGEPLPSGFGAKGRLQGNSSPQYNPSANQATNRVTAPWQHINARLSVADVREVFFRTKEKLMRKCRFDRSGDMETWDVVNIRGEEHYSRSPTQRERSLIVKRLGKGRYTEADFAYVRTSTDMTLSWGVTYDSLVVSAKVDLLLPFTDIDYVDSERGLFTDTMTVRMKDGSAYELDEHQMMSTPVHDNIEDLAGFLNVIKEM